VTHDEALAAIESSTYGDYARVDHSDSNSILQYLLGVHAEAASLYTERRILETARNRTDKVIDRGVDPFTVGGKKVPGHELRPDEVRLLVF
jgi:hypothetical protein